MQLRRGGCNYQEILNAGNIKEIVLQCSINYLIAKKNFRSLSILWACIF